VEQLREGWTQCTHLVLSKRRLCNIGRCVWLSEWVIEWVSGWVGDWESGSNCRLWFVLWCSVVWCGVVCCSAVWVFIHCSATCHCQSLTLHVSNVVTSYIWGDGHGHGHGHGHGAS
jgi:hypothetical protein